MIPNFIKERFKTLSSRCLILRLEKYLNLPETVLPGQNLKALPSIFSQPGCYKERQNSSLFNLRI